MTLNTLTLCTLAAAVLYCGSGFAIISAMKSKEGKASSWLRWPILLGLILQAFALHGEMFRPDSVHFGFGYAVAETCFFAVIILLIETWIHRLHGQFGIALCITALGTLMPLAFPGQAIVATEWTPVFRWHLFFAIAGYAFMFVAVIQAILIGAQNRRLKEPREGDVRESFLDSMPGLIVMERIFFRIVAVGFLCISCTLVLGSMATHETYGTWLHIDHKTVLTWISWCIFCILLLGRTFAGWRAKTALSWFWAGIVLFCIAYFGYSLTHELLRAV